MPGDAAECKKHAQNCLEIAERTSNNIEKRVFTDLAMTWVMMAREVERAFAQIEDNKRAQINAVNG